MDGDGSLATHLFWLLGAGLAVFIFSRKLASLNKRVEKAERERDAALADTSATDLRDLLTDAVDSISEGFVLFDRDGTLVVVNDHYKTAYPSLAPHMQPGITFEDLLRQAAELQGLGENPQELEGWVQKRLQRHLGASSNADVLLSDGHWYRISERATRTGGVVKLLTCITELKQQQAETANHAALLDATFSSVVQGIAVFGPDRSLTMMNEQAGSLLDLPKTMSQPGVPYGRWAALNRDRAATVSERETGVILIGGSSEDPDASEGSHARFRDCHVQLPEGRTLDWVHTGLSDGGMVLTLTDITRSEKLKTLLQGLAQTAGQSAQEVCTQLCSGLAQALNTDYTFIGQFEYEGDGDDADPRAEDIMVRIAAAQIDNAPSDTRPFSAKGTPSETLLTQVTMILQKGVAAAYPEDSHLQSFGAQSYAGQLLLDSTGKPLGVLAAIGRQPFRSLDEVQELLPVFATRAAAELERNKAAESLAVRESQLRTFVEFSPAAVAMTDREFRYLRVSRRWMSDFQIPENRILGCSHFEVIPETPDSWRADFERVLDGAVLEEDEITLERLGKLQWLRRQLHPWQRSDGSIGGVMMFIEVITARKEAEMALQHSQKMDAVGRLAGGIAHEFNNMLNAIGGFARMARRTPERADRVETCLDEIIGSTDRASELTGQLLSYSRRDVTGKVNNVAPGPLLRDSAKFLRPVLGENIDVSVNCPEDLPELRADGNQLRQALTNLMINARDAMEGKGSITITASLVLPSIALRRRLALRSEERFVLLAVTDNGPGIPESLRTRIFEPFFTTKEQGKGTGLGLAQVYSTCEQAGGAIDIQSQVGDGTTFLLYFPEGKELKIDDRAIATEPSQGLAAQTPGDGEQETSPDDYDPLSELAILEDLEGLEELEELEAEANAAPSPLTILMAEDDPAVRRLVRLTLEEEGHVVYAAEDGQQAVDLALDDGLIEEIDLLVSDVRMPKMGGLDLLAALRVRRPDLKVIFLSGYVEEEDLDVLVSDPLGLLLDKPVLRETLLDALSSISKE